MRAWELQDFGLNNLRLVERAEPVPGAGQVKLRVKAASLNSRDLQVIYDKYDPNQRLPIVPVSDGVGEVVEVGAGVSRVAVGDRVVGAFAQGWMAGERTWEKWLTHVGGHYDGMLQEYVVLEADGVVAVPAYLSDAEAAAASVAAVTAWQALVIQGHLKAGETVLVEGTGGVSLFALQFATAAGARVIVTSSSDAKIARALELGAWHGVNYVTEPDWGQAVLELTAGEGVDHVIENAGDLGQSVDALRPGGLVSLIGYLSQLNLTSADPPSYRYELDIVTALLKNVRLQGISAAPRESYESMFRAMETSELRPVIDRRYDLANAIDALVSLRDEGAFGKICIDIG
jgi:NADPH:quinone reductase-like Zn-dependent oxidoreductase